MTSPRSNDKPKETLQALIHPEDQKDEELQKGKYLVIQLSIMMYSSKSKVERRPVPTLDMPLQ